MGDIQWPKADRVERRDDMSASGKLTVMLQRDGDVVVNVCKGDTATDWESATVEFCAGAGGGRSMRTREALIALMVAIEADNAERPISDADGVDPSRAVKQDVAQAMAAEYAELMAHMDGGGDYFEFMAKRQHSAGVPSSAGQTTSPSASTARPAARRAAAYRAGGAGQGPSST